jgi:transcriptional regulator with XRE-family HTH domain
MTQRQLAEPAYTPAYISTLEAGRVRTSEEALRHLAERLGVGYEELATGRPARLATDLRLRLTEAQRALATEGAEEAAGQYAGLLAEAEAYELPEERAAALLGLGECAVETGELVTGRQYFEQASASPTPAPRCPPGYPPCADAPSPTTSPVNSATPSTSSKPPSTS